MPGITEADMNRINEFLKRTKFEREPELLCPGEDEGEAEPNVTTPSSTE